MSSFPLSIASDFSGCALYNGAFIMLGQLGIVYRQLNLECCGDPCGGCDSVYGRSASANVASTYVDFDVIMNLATHRRRLEAMPNVLPQIGHSNWRSPVFEREPIVFSSSKQDLHPCQRCPATYMSHHMSRQSTGPVKALAAYLADVALDRRKVAWEVCR